MHHRLQYGSLAIVTLAALIMTDWLLSGGSKHPVLSELLGGSESFGFMRLLRHGSVIPLFVAVVIAMGAFELSRMVRSIGLLVPTGWVCTCSVALVLAPWIFALTAAPEMRLGAEGLLVQIVLLLVVVLGTGILCLDRKPDATTLPSLAMSVFTIAYCGFLGSFLVMIRCDDGLPLGQGAWLVMILLLLIKVSDIGAFFTGSLIGGPKLIPWISPGKTISGAIGGVAASMLFAWGMWALGLQAISTVSSTEEQVQGWMQASEIFATFGGMSLKQVLILGAIMAVMGQLGDLIESVIKRSTDVKDSGALIPSFGGILDLIDSPLAAVPVAWLLLHHVWKVF